MSSGFGVAIASECQHTAYTNSAFVAQKSARNMSYLWSLHARARAADTELAKSDVGRFKHCYFLPECSVRRSPNAPLVIIMSCKTYRLQRVI